MRGTHAMRHIVGAEQGLLPATQALTLYHDVAASFTSDNAVGFEWFESV